MKSSKPAPATEDQATQEYRAMIERLSSERTNQRIPNGKPMHASILLEAMFRTGRDEVRIFTGELAPETYARPELINAARRFLQKPGRRLRVLLQKKKPLSWVNDVPLLRVLKDGCGDSFEVRCATGAYASDAAHHFAVMDSRAYRFEHDHSGTKAIANFNEPAVAASLVAAFDAAFALGERPAG